MAKNDEETVVSPFAKFNNLQDRNKRGGMKLSPEEVQELKQREADAAKLRAGRGHRIKPGEGFVKK